MELDFYKTRANRPGCGTRCCVGLPSLLAVCLFAACFSGCAALTFPVSGIPVHEVPRELLGEPKDLMQTIDLSLLRQPPPDVYRLATGDILGIWIDGILGERGQTPPLHYSVRKDQPPGFGFPIPVREDGSISLPLVPPIYVSGLSLAEAEATIVRAYTTDVQLLQPGRDRILVSLMRPRTYRVLVIRQDGSQGATLIGTELIEKVKRGTGHEIELPAYENDVLSALARTGGLPGLGAVNKIVVQRGAHLMPTVGPNGLPVPTEGAGRLIEIPLRTYPGQPLMFGPADVILGNGDVVFIEARDDDFFYTGGLLPSGQYPLPRDHDLDVVEAISFVLGTIANGGFQTNSVFVNSFVDSGIGGPSPSLVIVLRRTPDGRQVPIRVDLNLALRDARERILIQPNDVVLLQETPDEATTRYVAKALKLFGEWTIWDRAESVGVGTMLVP